MTELPENGPSTAWFATVNVASVCRTGLSGRVFFISHYALSLYVLPLTFDFGCAAEWFIACGHMPYHSHMIISTDCLFQTEFIVGEFSTYRHSYLYHIPFVHDLESQVLPHMRNRYAMGPVCPFYGQILFSAFWALRLLQEFKYFTNVAWQWDTSSVGLHVELSTGSNSFEPWICSIFQKHLEQMKARYQPCPSLFLSFRVSVFFLQIKLLCVYPD